MRKCKICYYLVMWIEVDIFIPKFLKRIEIIMNIQNFTKLIEVVVNIRNFRKWIENNLIIRILRIEISLTVRNTI